jgi:hypothetical protein
MSATEPTSAPGESPTLVSQFVSAFAFLVGAATFVLVNVVLFVLAYPTLPNPGPQSDIRIPLCGVILVVVMTSVLLRRVGGLAFGAGFTTGLLAETLFMGACVTPWFDPGGTARAEAAYQRQRPIEEALAVKRQQARWISEKRRYGLDLAEGFRQLELATSCVLTEREKHGEFPRPKDSLPDAGQNCYELHRLQGDERGWRVLYTRIPGRSGDPAVEFRVRVGPDAALRLPGPFLETDYRGLIVRRDSTRGPAFAAGSPVQPIVGVVLGCINKAKNIKGESPTGVLTLYELVFASGHHCDRIQLEQVKNDNGTLSSDPNVARLYIPATGPYAGVTWRTLATSWDLFYVPHGKTPADGYDLHVRPVRYGESGIRSYLMTAGQTHVTWENRAATVEDPLVEECEIDPWKSCGI